jgi:hypothetical protein
VEKRVRVFTSFRDAAMTPEELNKDRRELLALFNSNEVESNPGQYPHSPKRRWALG